LNLKSITNTVKKQPHILAVKIKHACIAEGTDLS